MVTKDFSIAKDSFAIDRKTFCYKPKNMHMLVVLILVFLVCFLFAQRVYNDIFDRDLSVANFRYDINQLSMAAKLIESMRVNNKYDIEACGSEGDPLTIGEVRPGLKAALLKVADIDNDGSLSKEEILKLEIKRVKQELYLKKFQEFQLSFLSIDRNLRHYVVITRGKEEGTILYNGSLKYTDSENKTYFGLELYK
jgi:hypothetical protein